jgi:hypothetical protein
MERSVESRCVFWFVVTCDKRYLYGVQLGCKWILKQISGDCVVCAYGNVGLVELEPGVVVWGYWIWDVSCMYVFGWGGCCLSKGDSRKNE